MWQYFIWIKLLKCFHSPLTQKVKAWRLYSFLWKQLLLPAMNFLTFFHRILARRWRKRVICHWLSCLYEASARSLNYHKNGPRVVRDCSFNEMRILKISSKHYFLVGFNNTWMIFVYLFKSSIQFNRAEGQIFNLARAWPIQ